MHTEKHPLAGQTVRIKADVVHPQYPDFGGSEFRIEDWWDHLTGSSWMFASGNPGCIVYALRNGMARLPIDDEVIYGHRNDGFGSLIHVSEYESNS